MLVKLMKSKIHRATVTRADLNYEGSIAVDGELLDAAGILNGESVHVWNVNNGERFETYALPLERGSGEICVNGAAARLVEVGDLVIVTAFFWIEDKEAREYASKVILVDEKNRPQ
ncbi:MAG: aspartate 1-decarboxylase [Terriglobales bacterium]